MGRAWCDRRGTRHLVTFCVPVVGLGVDVTDDPDEIRPVHIVTAVLVVLFMFASLVAWVITSVKS